MRLPNASLITPGDAVRAIRSVAAAQLRSVFDQDRFEQEQYTDPPGDPGLFGPDSVTWRVHADPAMIVGGISALMLQTLHPLAMAGVADHSDYRQDPFRRLSRTASFVTATTFGSTQVATDIVDIVRSVHTRVTGVAPDGRPYAASDPDLLRWVHITEVGSFLRAHRRFNPLPVRGHQIDRYFAEVAVVAEMLGATDVPHDRAQVRSYLRAVRPELGAGDQARATMEFVLTPPSRGPAFAAVYLTLVRAAVGLLPPWARDLHGLRHFGLAEEAAVRPAAAAVLSSLRMITGEPVPVVEARERCRARVAA